MTADFHHYLNILHYYALKTNMAQDTEGRIQNNYILFSWCNSATAFILLLTDPKNEAAHSEETIFISSACSSFKSLCQNVNHYFWVSK